MFLFKSLHFLQDIRTNVLPSNNDHYLEFHHGVPAHLVSVGVRYWIHSNQLGFISNSDSVETWEEDCLRGSWETRCEESKGLCEVEEGRTPVYLCWLSPNYVFPCRHQTRVYLCFSSCPCTFITGQTVVFGTTPRLRVQTESRTWFKKKINWKAGNTTSEEQVSDWDLVLYLLYWKENSYLVSMKGWLIAILSKVTS